MRASKVRKEINPQSCGSQLYHPTGAEVCSSKAEAHQQTNTCKKIQPAPCSLVGQCSRGAGGIHSVRSRVKSDQSVTAAGWAEPLSSSGLGLRKCHPAWHAPDPEFIDTACPRLGPYLGGMAWHAEWQRQAHEGCCQQSGPRMETVFSIHLSYRTAAIKLNACGST